MHSRDCIAQFVEFQVKIVVETKAFPEAIVGTKADSTGVKSNLWYFELKAVYTVPG